MDLIASKVAVLILFGLLKFITGLAPSLILKRLKVNGKKKIWLEKAMGGVLCVGGGVLLATVFVHMLPEVRETLETAKKQLNTKDGHDEHDQHEDQHEHEHEEHDHGYPFAELVTCAGFFVIYFVEAIVHRIVTGTHGGGSGSHGHSHAIPPCLIKEKTITEKENHDENNDSGSLDHEKYAISTPNSSTTADSGVDNPGFRIENEGLSTNDLNEMTCKERDVTRIENDNFNNIGANRLTSTTNATDLSEHPDSAIWSKSTFSKKYKTHSADSKDVTTLSVLSGRSNVYNVSSAKLTSYTTYSNEEGDHSLDEASLPNHYGLPAVDTETNTKASRDRERKVLFSVRNFLIVLALSIHSIFEGMAIGLQLSVADVWKLFLAVSIHDVPVHFCVGMEMFNGGIKKLHIILYFLTLGIITPVGIIIGIIVTEHAGENGDSTQTLIIGVLQGLAGGTLLYITFYEVLDREKLSKAGMTGILGCVLLTCGFVLMAGLEAAGGHSHGVMPSNENHHLHDLTDKHHSAASHHGHSHNNDNHDENFATLQGAIRTYEDHNNHLDLENEITGIYRSLDNNHDNEEEHHDHDSEEEHHHDSEEEHHDHDSEEEHHHHDSEEEHHHHDSEKEHHHHDSEEEHHDHDSEEEHHHIHEHNENVHDHAHVDEHDHQHEHLQDHEAAALINSTQSSPSESMFLTLQNGR